MIGKVAPTAHQNGNTISAANPRMVKVPQKIFFSILQFYASARTRQSQRNEFIAFPSVFI
jgi:hypothetical protein